MEDPYEIQLNKPQHFNPNKKTISEEWRLWKQNFLIYLELTEAQLKFSKKKLAYLLLNFMGPTGIKAKEDMTFSDPSEEENMDILLKKFDEAFDPPTNEMEERYTFFSRYKFDEEPIENYIKCLKDQASKCNFAQQTEKFVMDMIILNIDCYNLREHIFSIENLSLPMAIKLYEEYLINEEKIKNILCNEEESSSENNDFIQNIEEQESKLENSENSMKSSELYDDIGQCTEQLKENLLLDEIAATKKTTAISSNLEYCLWCESTHLVNRCKHDKTCWRCNAFPHNICLNCKKNPHDADCSYKCLIALPSKELSKGLVCSKCNASHLSSADCPAQHVVCKNCFTPGHYTNVCERKWTLNIEHQEKIIHEKFTLSSIEIENCSWCELSHKSGYCQHDWLCRGCDDFPHNVCFKCKNNPHTDICHFKNVITLPAKSTSTKNLSQPGVKVVCSTCFQAGHSASRCSKNRLNQNHSKAKDVSSEYRTHRQPNQTFVNSKPQKSTAAVFGLCPICNFKCLYRYDEDYDFCNYCENYIMKKQLEQMNKKQHSQRRNRNVRSDGNNRLCEDDDYSPEKVSCETS